MVSRSCSDFQPTAKFAVVDSVALESHPFPQRDFQVDIPTPDKAVDHLIGMQEVPSSNLGGPTSLFNQ